MHAKFFVPEQDRIHVTECNMCEASIPFEKVHLLPSIGPDGVVSTLKIKDKTLAKLRQWMIRTLAKDDALKLRRKLCGRPRRSLHVNTFTLFK